MSDEKGIEKSEPETADTEPAESSWADVAGDAYDALEGIGQKAKRATAGGKAATKSVLGDFASAGKMVASLIDEDERAEVGRQLEDKADRLIKR
jgi:hypothetical protein